MRLLTMFSPLFLEWGIDLVLEMKKLDPALEVVALTNIDRVDRAVRKALEGKLPIKFIGMETQERLWLDAPADEAVLADFERRLGPGRMNKSMIADRHVGAAYIQENDPVDSLLSRRLEDPETLRRYNANMYGFMDRLLTQEKPDMCFLYCVAGGYTFALADLVKERQIGFYQIQPTRIENYYAADDSVEGYLTPIKKRYDELKSSPAQLNAQFVEDGKKWLVDFRARFDVLPEYEVENRMIKRKAARPHTHVVRFVRALGRAAFYNFKYGPLPLRSISFRQAIKTSITYPYRLWALNRSDWFRSTQDFLDRSYVFFPLHVSPEASTMVLAPHHTHQLAVIEALSKSMPSHVDIVVKEHPMMMGLRPLSFYKRLRALPNVSLVEVEGNTQLLINKSLAVVTITGTVGWEAIIRGKPLVIVGDPPYMMLEKGFVHCPDLSRLAQALVDALAQDACPDENLLRYIAAVKEIGLPIESSILLEGPDADKITRHKDVTIRLARLLLGA